MKKVLKNKMSADSASSFLSRVPGYVAVAAEASAAPEKAATVAASAEVKLVSPVSFVSSECESGDRAKKKLSAAEAELERVNREKARLEAQLKQLQDDSAAQRGLNAESRRLMGGRPGSTRSALDPNGYTPFVTKATAEKKAVPYWRTASSFADNEPVKAAAATPAARVPASYKPKAVATAAMQPSAFSHKDGVAALRRAFRAGEPVRVDLGLGAREGLEVYARPSEDDANVFVVGTKVVGSNVHPEPLKMCEVHLQEGFTDDAGAPCSIKAFTEWADAMIKVEKQDEDLVLSAIQATNNLLTESLPASK